MRSVRLTAFIGLAAAAAALPLGAAETNAWPAAVWQTDTQGQTQSWTSLGPFFFSEPGPLPEGGRDSGFRPFYVTQASGGVTKTDILYPLFFYREYPDGYSWSILQLINGKGTNPGASGSTDPIDHHFDLWPLYFSYDAGNPADSYHALLPFYGTIKYRLGFQRIFWAPFPLYVQTAKSTGETTYFPWPIIRSMSGPEHGFAVWPLFGVTNGPDISHHSYFLWPLTWNNTIAPTPDAPEGTAPSTQFGVLPLYTRETGPGSISENYLWPFFGYTEQTIPKRYSEARYFWPFLVQGHGDGKLVERWGPFYTHSNSMGVDSTWVVWPLWHRTTWTDADIAQEKTSFFYFIYSSLDQTSVSRPGLAPAYKRHFWPLLSIWDNGAGSRQVQFISPFEVFFPDNPDMRKVWSPLTALYRYDHRPTGESRTSVLWDAITWRRDPSGGLSEFHLGPLLGLQAKGGASHWSILGFDFGNKEGHPDNPRQ